MIQKLFGSIDPPAPKPLDVQIYGWLREGGMRPHVAAAFMDSFMAESGMDPGINERRPLIPGSRGGRGLYQLTGPRRRQYETRYGYDFDAYSQIQFLFWELENTERRARDRINATNTREAAVRAITKYFLRPAVDNSHHRIGMWKGTVV